MTTTAADSANDDDAAPESATETSMSRPAFGIRWTTTKAIVSGLIAVVGAVAGVISVIQVYTRDTTNFSHLTIAAEQAPGERSDWAVPGSHIADLPLASDAPCGSEQLDWLEANALPLQRRLLLTLSNKAKEGSMLALTNLHSVSDVATERGEVHVLLICDPSGVVADSVYYGRVDADKPGKPARHVRLEFGRRPNSSPEVPITYNLAPGESGQFAIEIFTKFPSSGSLVIDVLHRDERREVPIEGTDFQLPSLLFSGDMYLVTGDDGVQCRRAEAGSLSECTFDDIQLELARAER